jgi:hypothetical protein
MTTLIHIAYASEAVGSFSDVALGTLLERARVKNETAGITGILLLVETSFFQLIEGEPDAIRSLYAVIENDERHRRAVKLIEEPIEKREFAEWSMGLARATSKELSALPGFRNFSATRQTLDKLGEGMARRLLNAFRDGQWRARVGK